jgi:hypothetical protein
MPILRPDILDNEAQMLSTFYNTYRAEYKEGTNSCGVIVSSLYLCLVLLFSIQSQSITF